MFIAKTNQFILFRETNFVYYENHMKHTNTLGKTQWF
jgi:hypothetical protein